MEKRPRRLRKREEIRRLVRETRICKDGLVYPMFIKEGKQICEEIPSLEGQYRYSVDRMPYELEALCRQGISSVMLFGIPEKKDEWGSGAYQEDGVIQQALYEGKKRFPNLYFMTDVCLCEYTSHGHCGMLKKEEVDNDSTLSLLEKVAVSHAQAGADTVAPSDMMDGRIGRIRGALDQEGYQEIPILSYAVKYASGFYAPFREAAHSAPSFGNRKGYQMDYHNIREAVREVELDEAEGADIIMIKPALSYLDVIGKVRERTNLPIAAYSVSGEYAMVKAAAKQGWISEEDIFCEMAAGAFRAGANIYLTYAAKQLAKSIEEGRLG